MHEVYQLDEQTEEKQKGHGKKLTTVTQRIVNLRKKIGVTTYLYLYIYLYPLVMT